MVRTLPTLIVVALLATAGATEAQIYSWRDANGGLVLSDSPREGATVAVPVRGVTTIGATRVAPPSVSPTIDGLIVREAARQGVRPELVRAVIQVESAFDPAARSPKGAMGLMQLMPGTAKSLGVTDSFDPRQNILGGARYLRKLANTFDGDKVKLIAAYHAGPGIVSRRGGIPYKATERYVRRVLTHWARYRASGL